MAICQTLLLNYLFLFSLFCSFFHKELFQQAAKIAFLLHSHPKWCFAKRHSGWERRKMAVFAGYLFNLKQIGKMSQLENRIGHSKIQQGTGNKFQIVTNGLVTISNLPQFPVEFQNGLCSFSVPPAVILCENMFTLIKVI